MKFFSGLAVAATLATLPSLVSAVGPCAHPSQRKEWRALTTKEKTDWLSAYKCLTKLPHSEKLAPTINPDDIPPVNKSGSYFDDVVYLHMDLNRRIHFTGQFFPWHRYYLHHLENAMKTKCGFTGSMPYWNWSIDSHDVYNSNIFKESDPKSGLGGWGNPADDYQLSDGALVDVTLSYPVPHRPMRNFTAHPFVQDPTFNANVSFTPEEVSKVVNGFVGDFKGFQAYIEAPEGMHGAVHLMMGGDLGGVCPSSAKTLYPSCQPGPTWSANEAMFYMHHGMIDKLWYDWQHKDPKNALAFHGGSIQNFQNLTQYPNGAPPNLNFASDVPGDGLFPDAHISDVMDTKGGYLCYEYV